MFLHPALLVSATREILRCPQDDGKRAARTMTQQPQARDDLEKIYRAAVAAVDPGRLVSLAMDGGCRGAEQVPDLIAGASRILLLAVGKASLGMAREIERRVGDRLADAIAVTTKDQRMAGSAVLAPGSKVRVVASSHPVPGESSEEAARLACEMLHGATTDDLVIVALSGGASAMFVRPAEGLTLADKIAVNQALLKAGASIRELNIVRRHLSAVKGGRLLHHCGGARVLSLIISDVPGNDLATIGSGLTAGDWSSFGDAVAVLKRRSVWGRAPEAVRSYLERAVAGEVGATVKVGDPILERVTNAIIGDNDLALEAAERAAAELGYHPRRGKALYGEANDAGRALAQYLCEITDERICVVAGGEPVVTVRGGGKGGRAQQCALAMGIELSQIGRGQRKQIAALFAGTDGIDGPTDAAGAFASPITVADGERAGVSAATALTRNDAYNFFKASGGLFVTGTTGTNVSDIFVGLVNY
jgi:glycerate 2-kinase